MDVLALYAGRTAADFERDWGKTLVDSAGDDGTTITTTNPRATRGVPAVCGGRTMIDSVGEYDCAKKPNLEACEEIQANMDGCAASIVDVLGDYGIAFAGFAGDNGTTITTTNPTATIGGLPMITEHTPQSDVPLDPPYGPDWSCEEQQVLLNGLARYADEHPAMAYIKIANLLPGKTARDVAFRSKWTRSLKGSSSGYNSRSVRKHVNNEPQPQLLLADNKRIFKEIESNLRLNKLEDNEVLFKHIRQNISQIQERMMGVLSDIDAINRMPPLPVSVNDEVYQSLCHVATMNDINVHPPSGNHSWAVPRQL